MSRRNNGKLSEAEVYEKREKGFQMTGLQSVKLKEYNALHDPNMRHFFESKNNQFLLYRTGQIDSNGRVIDLDKNKSKLFILDREFKEAERVEDRRQKEEMEMRYRVQRKRFNELEKMRKLEILEKLKAERDLSREIVATLRLSATGGFDAKQALSSSKSGHSRSSTSKSKQQHDAFFVTNGDEEY